MMPALVLSLLIPAATGVLLLRLLWPRGSAPWPWPVGLALGAGFGAGLSATWYFLWMLGFGATPGLLLAEAGVLVVAVIATAIRGPGRDPVLPAAPSDSVGGSRLRELIGVAFLVALAAAAAGFLAILQRQPHGEWDAWMNWDLRARMMYRGGEAWRAAFSAEIPWSHPDYPVLVPSLVVRSWLYAGRETLRGPALVAAAFTFGTVLLLVAAIAALRSRSQGLLAGLVLLSTPFFIIHGTSLYADVPLGFFFLATIVCVALDGRYGGATSRFALLAGVAAGFAVWTKNEGLLFTVAVGGGFLLAGWRDGSIAMRRRLLAFGAGVLPFLLLTAGFKISFAPPNDLLSTLGIERTLGNLTDSERYYLTLRAYAIHIPAFGSNGFGTGMWVLAAILLGFGISRSQAGRPWARGVAGAIVLLLAGHFMVFVSMAHELQRLLNSSLDRLLLQLWPSVLFVFFMVVSTLEEKGARRGFHSATQER